MYNLRGSSTDDCYVAQKTEKWHIGKWPVFKKGLKSVFFKSAVTLHDRNLQ